VTRIAPADDLPAANAPPMRIVAALVRDRADLARLRAALRPSLHAPRGAQLHEFVDLGALERALERTAFDVLVIEAVDAQGLATEAAIQRIRHQFPRLSILGHVVLKTGLSGAVLSFARAGVHELVFAGFDDSVIVLQHALHRASQRCIAEEVLHDLSGAVTADALPLLRYCLEHATDAPRVDDMARALGVHRRTLVNRMRYAMLPPPSELWAWARLLLAARHLESPGRSVDWVATTIGYPSANALRNALKKYTGLVPSDLRHDGGFARTLVLFRATLLADDRASGAAKATRRRSTTYPRPTLAQSDASVKASNTI
jgi:AraC-like DNA-binding protein